LLITFYLNHQKNDELMIKRDIMSDFEHRPGVKEATLVVRNLRLTGVDNGVVA